MRRGTPACLDRIEAADPEFPYRARLVTGASGGMVGLAAWVATLAERPAPGSGPHCLPRGRLLEAMTRDSLTPAVRHLVLHDVPSLFDPHPRRSDRGRALDAAWAADVAELGLGVRELLLPGERLGWRPSLVVSRMLVEDGEPLLISNLDLGFLPGGELFKLFEPAGMGMKGFPLATAVRMSAAFPYVTPAVPLPTTPPRRVVDAGYLDNYGVGIAAAWFRKNLAWLRANTSGVRLVQFRAYPTAEVSTSGRGYLGDVAAGLAFATTPFEGYAAAKARNEEAVWQLREAFNRTAPGFFQEFVLDGPAEGQAALSWALTRRDRERPSPRSPTPRSSAGSGFPSGARSRADRSHPQIRPW